MTRFINTTLTGLVAFFVFLAVLWLFVDPAAPGLKTQDDPPSVVRVESTDARWGATDAAGTRVHVEMLLENEGTAATVTQVAYRATVDGSLMAAATEDPPVALPAESTSPMRFTVLLPPDFASAWFSAYRSHDEAATLRIDGTIAVRMASGDHRVPFSWENSWRGELLERLADGPQECPGPPAPMCLAELQADWKGNGLATTVVVRNDRAEPLIVRNGTFRLVFEDVTVATGRLDGTLEIPSGEKAELDAILSFDPGAMAQWWIGHVERCETSRLSFNVGLEIEGVDASTSQVDWDILAAPYRTGFICGSA